MKEKDTRRLSSVKKILTKNTISFILILISILTTIFVGYFMKSKKQNDLNGTSQENQRAMNYEQFVDGDEAVYKDGTQGTGNEEIITDGMGIDMVLDDGDKLELGNGHYIVCLSTKGHTDCAMTYVLEPDSVMFTSESTGICSGPERSEVAILKSYDDSMESLEKCRSYGAKRIVSPHYGIVPEYYNDRYWEVFEEKAKEEKEYTVGMWNSGLSPEQMLEKATKEVFEGGRGNEQPYEAFVANAKAVIKMYEQYADPDKKYNSTV